MHQVGTSALLRRSITGGEGAKPGYQSCPHAEARKRVAQPPTGYRDVCSVPPTSVRVSTLNSRRPPRGGPAGPAERSLSAFLPDTPSLTAHWWDERCC